MYAVVSPSGKSAGSTFSEEEETVLCMQRTGLCMQRPGEKLGLGGASGAACVAWRSAGGARAADTPEKILVSAELHFVFLVFMYSSASAP